MFIIRLSFSLFALVSLVLLSPSAFVDGLYEYDSYLPSTRIWQHNYLSIPSIITFRHSKFVYPLRIFGVPCAYLYTTNFYDYPSCTLPRSCGSVTSYQTLKRHWFSIAGACFRHSTSSEGHLYHFDTNSSFFSDPDYGSYTAIFDHAPTLWVFPNHAYVAARGASRYFLYGGKEPYFSSSLFTADGHYRNITPLFHELHFKNFSMFQRDRDDLTAMYKRWFDYDFLIPVIFHYTNFTDTWCVPPAKDITISISGVFVFDCEPDRQLLHARVILHMENDFYIGTLFSCDDAACSENMEQAASISSRSCCFRSNGVSRYVIDSINFTNTKLQLVEKLVASEYVFNSHSLPQIILHEFFDLLESFTFTIAGTIYDFLRGLLHVVVDRFIEFVPFKIFILYFVITINMRHPVSALIVTCILWFFSALLFDPKL